MTFEEWLTTFGEFVADYWIVIAVLCIFLTIAIIKKYNEKKARLNKQTQESDKMNNQQVPPVPPRYPDSNVPNTPYFMNESGSNPPNQPTPNFTPSPEPQGTDFAAAFRGEKTEEPKKEGISDLNEMTDKMRKDYEALNEETQKEFENMREQLRDVNIKKEQIRKSGLELAKLFEEYEEREKHLTNMMMGLEEIMKKRQQSYQSNAQG